MLLKPIAKTLIRHKLAELTKLRVEWLSIHVDVVHHQVGDGMVARFAIHARFSPNDPSSATAATRRADCNREGPPFAAAHG
jgi:hypothetical protein